MPRSCSTCRKKSTRPCREPRSTARSRCSCAADLSTAQASAAKAAGDLDAANKAGADKDAQIADLQQKLTAFTNPTSGGPTAAAPTQQMIDNLNQQIQELNASLSSANEKVKTDQDTIANYKKQDEDRRLGLAKQGLEGRVLAVNPAWNFVVLSIGDKQGVTNNSEMLLKRSGQYLGKVRITSVEPSTSIADIVANTLPAGVAVQPGDSVIFQGTQQE